MLRVGLLLFFSFLFKTEAQTFTCDPANNTLGTCECNQQLFISEDCTKGFFCFNGTSDDTGPYDGCHIICTEGRQLLVDPRNGGSWKCVPFNDTISCPGKFNTECECNGDAETCPIGDCECEGQLRVSEDCKTAKYCEGDSFQEISCNETLNEIVYVNLNDHTWACGEDDKRCPGAFHVGCQQDPTEDPTVDPTEDPTVEPTVDPTEDPTVDPTVDPTEDPTVDPTVDPTEDPSEDPGNGSNVTNLHAFLGLIVIITSCF